MSLINSIPADWRSLLKASNEVPVVDPTPNIPTIRMKNGDLVPILDTFPTKIYQLFVQRKQTLPTSKQKLTNKYSDVEIRWDFLQTTLESKIREFQYKILNCIVLFFFNEKLSRIGLVESPNCSFCHEETESVEQLQFCKKTFEFWK